MVLDLHEPVTQAIIASAIEVHRHLGPGLMEPIYERALCLEFTLREIPFVRQVAIPLYYKGELLSEHRPVVVVESLVVVEIKSVARFEPVHTAQVLTYLKAMHLRVGLLLNFNKAVMKNGSRRVVL